MTTNPVQVTFPTYLMNSPYVTTNPEEADYFYVWAWLYNNLPGHKLGNPSVVINALKKMGPWWEKKGGKDHIFIMVCRVLGLGFCMHIYGV